MHAGELNEYAYTLVSNKHARIYCLQTAPCRAGGGNRANRGGGGADGRSGRSYEVYVEDTSNNGTVVNGTLLRRCERRLLNSGKEKGYLGTSGLRASRLGEGAFLQALFCFW
jgi:hypothetical protein